MKCFPLRNTFLLKFLAGALLATVATPLATRAQTETALYDGWANDYALGSNRTVFAAGLARPGTAGADPYYRYVDGDAAASGVQHFSATSGIGGVPSEYAGPDLHGGATYRDNVRPDDTASYAGTILSIRGKPYDADDGSGVKGDPLRAYIPADASGLTFDEAFGAILFDYEGGGGLTSLSWRGATNSANLTATIRWVVLDGGTLYVSEDSFAVADNGTATQTNSLADVTATNWAVWDPSADIADLKFSTTGPGFAAHAFTDVTKVGYLWEISDTGNATNYLDMLRFTATKQAVQPAITSPSSASGNVDLAFSYQITATENPTSYGVTGTLPDGLSLAPATGLISGTPTTEETQTVTISATNDEGTGTASLEITIGPVLPVPDITSPQEASAMAGGSFSYQITATNEPTSFSAAGLPAGLNLDPSTGLITGTAVEAGDYLVTVTAANSAGSQQAEITITVGSYLPPQIPGGRVYRCYFLGNSLTLSLSTSPQPHLARLERLFAERGNRIIFGATLGAGVNLDQHWNGQLYDGQWMKQGFFDDQHEYSVNNGWAGPGAEFGSTMFRDYNFALQGKRRDYDGTIVDGHVWDALVFQPYIAFLDADGYSPGANAIAPLGDRTAINNFIDYASGGNPSGFDSVKRYYIYSAWPQLIGVEGAAIDTDGNGAYSFSEFYDQPYDPPVNPPIPENPREHVPSRAYLTALLDAARADNPSLGDRIFVIPVGEVFAELDRLIRTGALPGAESHYNRNKQYYIDARADSQGGFPYIYPPGEAENYGHDFIAAQGIKNFYADNIHWNDQTHNDTNSGTFGAYVAAATIHTVITGENPDKVAPEAVEAYYEAFDATEDAALIAEIQDVIWQIVTSTDWHGVNYAERTGVGTPPEASASYRDFAAAHFTAQELQEPMVSDELADPDGDGDPNIREMFRLGDPNSPDGPLQLELTHADGQTTLRFRALSRPAGISPMLAMTSDLSGWEALDDDALLSIPSPVPGLDDYSMTLDTPGDQAFFQLGLPFIDDSPTLPLVVWGASSGIVASNQNAATGLGSGAVDLDTPANPAIGASYSTHSPVFFAASAATGPSNSADLFRINNHANPEDGTGDPMLMKWTATAGTDNAAVFTAIWLQQGDGSTGGFLNGADSGNVRLANLEVHAKVGYGSGSVSQMRFVIRKGSQFYISDDCGAVTSINTGANTSPYERITLPNPHGLGWYEYDPTTNPNAIGNPVALPSFDDITAVGFNWRNSGTESLRYLYIEKFQANFHP